MQEVSADKAYLANYNLAAIADGGAQPYIPFKTLEAALVARATSRASDHAVVATTHRNVDKRPGRLGYDCRRALVMAALAMGEQ